ncbi:MAG: hypothetical protein ACO3BD_01510 [Chitinophagaceae bacterium]
MGQTSDTLKLNGENLYNLLKINGTNEIALSAEAKQILVQENAELTDFQLDGIVKQNNNYLLYENGSGRLWQLNDSGRLTKWDKTKFAGDRFGAFEFTHNDTLYSMGGYGFWRVSGAIRYFNHETREWMVIPANQNVVAASGVNAIFFHAVNASKVFVIYGQYNDEYLIEKHQEKTDRLYLQIFDLVHKTWADNPKVLSQAIAKELDDIRVLAATSNALYLNSKYFNETLELDFQQNIYSEIEPAFLNDLQQIIGQRPNHMIEKSESSIIITDLNTRAPFRFDVSKYKKKKTGTIYSNAPNESKSLPLNSLLYISIGLNILLGATWARSILIRKKLDERESGLNEIDAPTKGKKFIDLLDAVELNIINTLSAHFKASKHTSIDEINKILGIEKRPYKIANNIRADALKMINKKFMDFSGNTDELIIRERSTFDKRFFEYTLNQRYINKV